MSKITAIPTQLLDDAGQASMATALMMSHHGFRRDLAQFAAALARVAAGERSSLVALQEEWQSFRKTLHGHHEAEDGGLFPGLRSQHAALAPVIDGLSADHRRIDPLLEQGDRMFAELPATPNAAAAVVADLAALLDAHLATEEREVIRFLRDAKAFPPPASEAEAEMYAQGFAWASHGVAAEVLEQVYAMLPASLAAKLPAARAAFERRCERVWGSASAGAARTSIPDGLR